MFFWDEDARKLKEVHDKVCVDNVDNLDVINLLFEIRVRLTAIENSLSIPKAKVVRSKK